MNNLENVDEMEESLTGDLEGNSRDTVDAGPCRRCHSTEDSIKPVPQLILKAAWYESFYVVICAAFYLADVITDLLVSVKYFSNGDYIWFSLTLLCVVGASFVMMVFSLNWHYDDTAEEVSKTKIVVLHLLQLGPLNRYWNVFWNGRKSRKTNARPKYYNMYLQQWRDIAMLRLFEAFIESAPQLVLQLYILAYNRHFDKDKDWLTAFSACMSLISLSSSLVSYSKALRDASVVKYNMSWWAFGCQLFWRITMVASRIVVLVLFASVYKSWILLVIGLHWVGMTLWLIYQKTSFDLNKRLKGMFYVIVGFIYIFCFFNHKDGVTKIRLIIFYFVMFVEDLILMILWFPYKNEYGVVFVAAVVMVFGGFSVGAVATLLYYHCYHPTLAIQGICARMCECLCCEDCCVQNTSDDLNEIPSGSQLYIDIAVSRGSVGRSVSRNRNNIVSPPFEKELLAHHPSEVQKQHSLDKHKIKMEKAQRLHELKNGIEIGTVLGHGAEGSETGQQSNGVKHDGQKTIAIDQLCIDIREIEQRPEINREPMIESMLTTKGSCNDALHYGMVDVERAGTSQSTSRHTCDDGLHCGTDDEQETGMTQISSSKIACDDGLHCGTDDEQETGPSVSKSKSCGLHCGTDDREESTKGEVKSQSREIQTPRYVNFHHRYSIVSDCISLSSSSSDTEEELKDITKPRNSALCIADAEHGQDSSLKQDDNGNFETIHLKASQDNAETSSTSLHKTDQNRKNKNANRVSFPNFVATNLKRGRFTSLRVSSVDFAAENKSKRHTVDLSELPSHGRTAKDYMKLIQRFNPTKFGSVREHLEELNLSAEKKI